MKISYSMLGRRIDDENYNQKKKQNSSTKSLEQRKQSEKEEKKANTNVHHKDIIYIVIHRHSLLLCYANMLGLAQQKRLPGNTHKQLYKCNEISETIVVRKYDDNNNSMNHKLQYFKKKNPLRYVDISVKKTNEVPIKFILN